MISHDLSASKQVAGRIVFLHDGRVVENVATKRLRQVKHYAAKDLVKAARLTERG